MQKIDTFRNKTEMHWLAVSLLITILILQDIQGIYTHFII